VVALFVGFADLIPLIGATLGAIVAIAVAALHSLPAALVGAPPPSGRVLGSPIGVTDGKAASSGWLKMHVRIEPESHGHGCTRTSGRCCCPSPTGSWAA
jgi:hypothetical protein